MIDRSFFPILGSPGAQNLLLKLQLKPDFQVPDTLALAPVCARVQDSFEVCGAFLHALLTKLRSEGRVYG